ncbi:MAG TPA: radical SAM family heme chaperone HemW [Tepidisphaeraceae bacterium]|nr:radical SAM family heme chaperone HemW [Tepidisphaeraceae bacterium]
MPTLTPTPPPTTSLDLARLPAEAIDGLYVHVPFCFHKCHYCDFYSITRQGPERMTRFVDLMLGEAALWAARFGGSFHPRTVFFGGGTPTLLPQDEMRRLIVGLRDRLDLSLVDEWTVEANPATVTADYCATLRAAGVDRLSFGAQSFNPADLKALERHHDPDDVPRSIDLARAARFDRLNVDLIYAIPGQSLNDFADTLDRAIALNTRHVSCYGLTYEPNTPIAVKKRLGQMVPAEESVELTMLRHARATLAAAGLPAYEISNYAAAGQACRHNLMYWTGGSYAGLGPSAASHVAGHRWRNRPHLGEWEHALARDELPAIEHEHLTPAQRAGELAMLQLRLASGLEFAPFEQTTGRDARQLFAAPIAQLTRVGLLELTPTALRLTDQGLAVADAIASEFLAASNG